MKRFIAALILTLSSYLLFAQTNAIDIYGSIEGPVNGQMKLFFEGDISRRDSIATTITDGKFHFKINRPGPLLANFRMGEHSVILPVYVEGPRTEINFANKIVNDDSLNSLTIISVKGSSTENLKRSFENWAEQLHQSGISESEISTKYFQQLYALMQANPSSKAGPYLMSAYTCLGLKQIDSLQKLIPPGLWQSWEVKKLQALRAKLEK